MQNSKSQKLNSYFFSSFESTFFNDEINNDINFKLDYSSKQNHQTNHLNYKIYRTNNNIFLENNRTLNERKFRVIDKLYDLIANEILSLSCIQVLNVKKYITLFVFKTKNIKKISTTALLLVIVYSFKDIYTSINFKKVYNYVKANYYIKFKEFINLKNIL